MGVAQVLRVLQPDHWEGRMFNGSWYVGAGGARGVIEPATGKLLSTVGIANPADIAVLMVHFSRPQAEPDAHTAHAGQSP